MVEARIIEKGKERAEYEEDAKRLVANKTEKKELIRNARPRSWLKSS